MLPGIPASAEETDGNSVLLKIRNCSDLEISYLRFDIYRGDEPAGIVVSCPNDGEDFYRCPYTPENQEELWAFTAHLNAWRRGKGKPFLMHTARMSLYSL